MANLPREYTHRYAAHFTLLLDESDLQVMIAFGVWCRKVSFCGILEVGLYHILVYMGSGLVCWIFGLSYL